MPNPLDLGAYGVIGIILFLLVTGWLWPKPAVDNILKKDSEVQALIDELATVRGALRRDLADLQTVNKNLLDFDKHWKAMEVGFDHIMAELMEIRREIRK